jgi:hypothetical protein
VNLLSSPFLTVCLTWKRKLPGCGNALCNIKATQWFGTESETGVYFVGVEVVTTPQLELGRGVFPES